MPKCRVIDGAFSWGDDRRPMTAMRDSIIYELHVKGFTKLHPQVPPQLRGTYAGLATPPVIDYFNRLGVTAIELLPVHAFVDDKQLVERNLRNYWGYNTIGYFAPEARYAAGNPVHDFKSMVQDPARGGHRGDSRRCLQPYRGGQSPRADTVAARNRQRTPTIGSRAIARATTWISPAPATRSTAATRRALRLISDSLRYWVDGVARRRLPLRLGYHAGA